MALSKTALKAEAALSTLLVDGTDIWPDDKRKLEMALEVVRRLAQKDSG